MKKLLIYTVIMTVSILFSACGSDSKKDPIPAPPPPPGGYAFSNFTSELKIDDYKTYPIEFQLTKDGLVVPDETVSMKVPDKSIGSIQKYTIVTDEKGKGTFIYTPPVVFPQKGTLYVVFTDGNITLEEKVLLQFDLNPDIPPKGHATTLSISYETTECDEKRGIVGHYHVHAVDRQSRLPIVNLPVKVSLINGVKLIHDMAVQRGAGTIAYKDPTSLESPIVFSDATADFGKLGVKKGDNLIIFPSEGKTNASYIGGWDIQSVSSSLLLNEQYTNLVEANALTYIVGNEERLLGGENGAVGFLATAHVEPDYTTDNDGYAYFDIVFDSILAGHTVSVEAHGDENGNRIGISMKTALRLDGDSFSAPDTIVANSGDIEKVNIPLSIKPSCTGSQPLIDVPVNPNSFHVTPALNCQIIPEKSEYYANGYGTVLIAVQTDGNATASENCTIKWDGDISSLVYEY